MDEKLATGQFDALTLIHNETSTGVMSPLTEIAALKKKYPDVMFIVDAVSSMTRSAKSNFDELGIDVLLAGTQKAFAMPPGLAVFVCSPAALAKAATIEGSRILLRFRRVPEERRTKHDAEHAEHRACVCAGVEAGRYSSPKVWKRVMRVIAKLAQMTRDWAARTRLHFVPGKRF